MSLRDRGDDFEARFAHDADLRFRVESRATKLLGLWAAGRLGRSGEPAETYAADLVRHDLGAAGSDDVVDKVTADLAGQASREEVVRQLGAVRLEAERQIRAQ
jgi:hypothetical protein